MSKTKVLASFVSGKSPVPGLQPSRCVLTWQRDGEALWGLIRKGSRPINHELSTSQRPTSSHHQVGIGISTHKL